MKLSILIPTLPERYNYLKRLQNILYPQVANFPNEVELKIHDAGRHMSTGAKRNALIANSAGDYFVQVDDDDHVPMYYVDELMKAIALNPDVITFIGHMTTDGGNRQNFTIKLGSRYETVNNHHYRYPNHLCCYKRAIVGHIPFPDITVTEDFQWAQRLQQLGLLKSEIHINKEMYFYDFKSNKNVAQPRIR